MAADAEPILSFADTTIGCMYLNVTPTAGPEVIDAVVQANKQRKESPESREEYVQTVMGIIEARHYSLIAHEWTHILQAITHPALYLRCLRELTAMFNVIDALKETQHENPLPMQLSDPIRAELSIPMYPSRIRVTDEGIPEVEAAPSAQAKEINDLSEVDLLEDSASIFQYKAEIGGESSAAGYLRWLEEGRHRYRRTFNFLSTFFSPEDAYVALPCLVMAGSMTNWPVNGFATLLAMTVRDGMAPSRMGTDMYWAYLETSLENSAGTALPDPRQLIHKELDHYRIDRDGMLDLAKRWQIHPISPLVELAWSDKKRFLDLREAMLHPSLAFNRDRRQAEEWLEPFRPPATSFRLLVDGLSTGDSVLLVCPTLADQSIGESSWLEYLIELMRIKAFVSGTTAPFSRESPHTCPHRKCRFHRHGMCRNWIHIPSRPEECNFPTWLEKTTARKFDFKTEALVPADNWRGTDGS
jgi:hypothetical protein